MADYPRNLGLHITSKQHPIDRVLVSELRGGGVKLRRLTSGFRYRFVVEHHGLTPAERTQLMSFLAANRLLTITLKWPLPDGTLVSYQVVWMDDELQWTDEGARYSATTVNFRSVF